MPRNQAKQRNQGYKLPFLLLFAEDETKLSFISWSFRKVWKSKCSSRGICYSRDHDSRPLLKQRCLRVTCSQKGFEDSTVQYCVFFCVSHTYKSHLLFWVPQIINYREPSHAEAISMGAANSRNVPAPIGHRHLWPGSETEMPHNCTHTAGWEEKV